MKIGLYPHCQRGNCCALKVFQRCIDYVDKFTYYCNAILNGANFVNCDIYQGCRALTSALVGLSCYFMAIIILDVFDCCHGHGDRKKVT